MSRISTRVLVAGGVSLVVLAVMLLVLPIRASSPDSSHDCGSLISRHPAVLRRQFCEQENSYRTRAAWVAGSGLIGGVSLIVAARRIVD